MKKLFVAIMMLLGLAGTASAKEKVVAPPPAPVSTIPAPEPDNILVLDLSTGGQVRIQLRPDKAPGHIERIKLLVGQGVNEIVLTGVDLTSYGPDLPGAPTLGSLVQRILQHVPDLPRLRLSSIDSIEVDAALFDVLATDARVMPQLHLSLQSGDDLILKRMKRRHARAQAVDFCQSLRARRPEMVFGADLIAGFPTETDAAFENTLALVDDCGLTRLHVFAYSERDGTPAVRMPQLPVGVRRDRAARLRALGVQRQRDWLAAQVGKPQRVLVEAGGLTGHAESFARVRLDRAHPRGAIVDVTARYVAGDLLECA